MVRFFSTGQNGNLTPNKNAIDEDIVGPFEVLFYTEGNAKVWV